MKIYKIKIKDNVHEFIWELGEYIFRHSFNFYTSKKIIDQIYKDIFSLKIFPNRYQEFNKTYRVLTINKKYRVFFIVDEKNMNVVISKIFSSTENYIKQF